MKVHFKPTTKRGKWSIWLIIAFGILMGIFGILLSSGQQGGETIFSNPLLSVAILSAGTAGIAAFFTGIASIIRDKERAVLVFITVVIGVGVLGFALGEIISPH